MDVWIPHLSHRNDCAINKSPPEDWQEVTVPKIGQTVRLAYSICDGVLYYDGSSGEIINIYYGTDENLYKILLDKAENPIILSRSDFKVEQYLKLPMWSSMFQFRWHSDSLWLTKKDNIKIMSDLGFRIYKNEEWGYFFGIDGAGYNFYESHWIPLYNKINIKYSEKENISRFEPKNIPLPDESISNKDLECYGYLWGGMFPLCKVSAEKLFHENLPIYKLYSDDTECLIYHFSEIKDHSENGGLFGVEKGDWETYLKTCKIISSEKNAEKIDNLRRRSML